MDAAQSVEKDCSGLVGLFDITMAMVPSPEGISSKVTRLKMVGSKEKRTKD